MNGHLLPAGSSADKLSSLVKPILSALTFSPLLVLDPDLKLAAAPDTYPKVLTYAFFLTVTAVIDPSSIFDHLTSDL